MKRKIKEIIDSIPTIKPTYKERNILIQLQKFEHVLQCNNRSLNDFNNILEFGCGFGRLIKYVIQINNTAINIPTIKNLLKLKIISNVSNIVEVIILFFKFLDIKYFQSFF